MILSKELVIILIGPPGAGKGTQADLLSDKFNLYHFDTSKGVKKGIKKAKEQGREFIEVDKKRYYFIEQEKKAEKGELWDSPFVVSLIKEKIKSLAENEIGIAFSGSPRTVYEAKAIIPFLEQLYGKENIFIFLIKVSPEISIFRNSHRRVCSLMRHSIIYNKETLNLKTCPLDASKLIYRKDDAEEIIKKRLNRYKKNTIPMIDYLKKNGTKPIPIKGDKTTGEVFQLIIEKIRNIRK